MSGVAPQFDEQPKRSNDFFIFLFFFKFNEIPKQNSEVNSVRDRQTCMSIGCRFSENKPYNEYFFKDFPVKRIFCQGD